MVEPVKRVVLEQGTEGVQMSIRCPIGDPLTTQTFILISLEHNQLKIVEERVVPVNETWGKRGGKKRK